jgi:hypothetical protein
MTITCQLSGGLGNQLNQIAYTLIQEDVLHDVAIFDSKNYTQLTQGNFETRYKRSIFRKVKWQDLTDSEVGIVKPIVDTTLFNLYRDRLIKLFKPPTKTVVELSVKYPVITTYPNCAIHVRRGDLSQFPGQYRILTPDYYQDAINKFDRDTKFLVFSDDIEYCRQIFIGDNFTFSSEAHDDRDLYLMSLCQHQIIANSTFSYWGAFLNENPDKIVLQPQF